ncbi:TetR/AcrR family transcriptional regulator [Streptomyces hoynatensis]|uniref:TetR/AcrR family transcriptional regulator n=1 Tax=Streptomyces hoynatensis TaxID=1141874 RepID=A0A3A9YRN0_9ACTN|nr:helix-turn-helix domain-containing protein [Streptomyces hoynatensis]RKN38761.1 TetR/AcrR family transcriptional regulator [Streptomyces hoynatensis]
MRADARRNREAIVEAALRLFTEHGAGVGMDRIATAAGLRVGTLYRHFDDRQALVEHIAVRALDDFLAFGWAEAAAEQPRWDALRALVLHGLGLPLALCASLTEGATAPAEPARLAAEAAELVRDLARGAQREGTLRSDLSPDEVRELLNVAICRVGARPGDALITVLLDGLRA